MSFNCQWIFSQFIVCVVIFRDELHICVCGPCPPGFLFSLQLGDAFPAESLGAPVPGPVGLISLDPCRIPAVQEEILPQNLIA